MKKIFVLIITAIIFFNFITILSDKVRCQETKGGIIYVGGQGSGNYSKIQDGINVSNKGDTILVYNGTYFENIDINKSIKLVGEDKNNTIIWGSYKPSGFLINAPVVKISADNVTITGFTITNATRLGPDYETSGLYVSALNSKIKNNLFTNNDDYAIWVEETENVVIKINELTNNTHRGILIKNSHNNTISGNTIQDNQELGITLTGSSFNLITNNTIKNNSKSSSISTISLYGSDKNTVAGNLILENYGAGIYTANANENLVSNNKLIKNSAGIKIHDSSTANIFSGNTVIENEGSYGHGFWIHESDENILSKNLVRNNSDRGIYIYGGVSNIIEENTIFNNTDGIRIEDGLSYQKSQRNIIRRNTIKTNRAYGVIVKIYNMDKNNTIYYNNFINNTNQASSNGDLIFYNPITCIGNYWSNYNGEDKNNDGIGDTPYKIDGGDNEDKYPLMKPINLSDEYNLSKASTFNEKGIYYMLVLGMIIGIIFLLPIGYWWRKKYFK